MKSTLKIRLFAFCLILLSANIGAYCQPENPNPPDVPITGIEILVGAGALLGARKLVQLKNKR